MTVIAGDVFSASRATGVDDEMAKRTAAEFGDIKDLPQGRSKNVGRTSPDHHCMDGTIPRSQLPHVLHRMRERREYYGLRGANAFHAGDGNLHRLIPCGANQRGEVERTEELDAEILRLCV
jgi:FAD/FMN-containing dehydrogenase